MPLAAQASERDPAASGRRPGIVARLARGFFERCRLLSSEILELDTELDQLVRQMAPTLLDLCGCATLSAAKILGETRHAYAGHNGTAPLPVWSGNRESYRFSRTGNRQLNAAIHRFAVTQAHYHPDARAFLARRRAAGDHKAESIRALKRRLSDVVFRALMVDAERVAIAGQPLAA